MKNARDIFTSVEQKILTANDLDLNFLGKMLGRLESSNVDFADIYFENNVYEGWHFSEGIIKSTSFAIDLGFGIRGVTGSTTDFAYSSEVNPRAVAQTTDVVCGSSKRGNECRVCVDKRQDFDVLYSDEFPFSHVARSYIVDILREMDAYAHSLDPRVRQVQISLSGGLTDSLVVASDTGAAADIRPSLRLSCNVTMEENGVTVSGHGACGRCIDFSWLAEDVAVAPLEHVPGTYCAPDKLEIKKRYLAVAREAVRSAQVELCAEPVKAGSMPLVLSAGWPAVLIHEAVGHGLEADAIRKGTSIFKDYMGKQIASPLCTIVDDGTIPERPGSSSVDSEGTPSKRNVLVENGRLQKYMTDKLNARLMGLELTGNGRRDGYASLPIPRMTNTYLLPGHDKIEDMIASVKDGIFAVNFGGGQVDPSTSKFTFSASEAYKIENGKIAGPVKGATLIGTGVYVLNKVSMLGENLELDKGNGHCGKCGQSIPVGIGQPALKLDEITVGGTL